MIITFLLYLVVVFVVGYTAERYISKSEENGVKHNALA